MQKSYCRGFGTEQCTNPMIRFPRPLRKVEIASSFGGVHSCAACEEAGGTHVFGQKTLHAFLDLGSEGTLQALLYLGWGRLPYGAGPRQHEVGRAQVRGRG